MLKKNVFLICVLMVSFLLPIGCRSPFSPTDDNSTPTKTHVEIDAHYYRVKVDFPDVSDTVSISCSWFGIRSSSKPMDKVEENHFKIYLEKVPVNSHYFPNQDKAHYVSVGDPGRKESHVGEKLVFNNTELVNRYYTSYGEKRYFWIDENGKIIQSRDDLI